MVRIQGMNNDGDVVGSKGARGFEGGHAFIWSHGRMTDISAMGNVIMTSAFAIDDQQQILGNAIPADGDCGDIPILYKRKMSADLRTFAGGKYLCGVNASTYDGRMIGTDGYGKTMLYSNGKWNPFMLPSGQTVSPLCRNLFMNNKGDVAEISGKRDRLCERWAEIGGKEYSLKGLPHANAMVLIGLSDSGIVAGNSFKSTPDSTSFEPSIEESHGGAFVWSVREGARALPALKGCSLPTVNAMSHSGDMAGTCVDAGGKRRITLWHSGKAEDISALTPALIGADLIGVCAINDHGQICVEVEKDSRRVAYILYPPLKPACRNNSCLPHC